jgi:hypothetical protein
MRTPEWYQGGPTPSTRACRRVGLCLRTAWATKVLLSHEEDSHDGFAFILEGCHFFKQQTVL